MQSDKIIITDADLTGTESPPMSPPTRVPAVPLWWRLLSVLLILCPPLLFNCHYQPYSRSGIGQLVGVTLQNKQRAHATIVGLHRTLDLALLWVLRERAQAGYVQPIRRFKTVEVGEQIFVIGHPVGLEFSISGGLVAQTRGPNLIQISAPVSPGNSGGPVYDTHGQLIAVVQSVIDKTKSPNAENLNFAVRADDLLNADAWTLAEEGRIAITKLTATGDHGRGESNLPETTK